MRCLRTSWQACIRDSRAHCDDVYAAGRYTSSSPQSLWVIHDNLICSWLRFLHQAASALNPLGAGHQSPEAATNSSRRAAPLHHNCADLIFRAVTGPVRYQQTGHCTCATDCSDSQCNSSKSPSSSSSSTSPPWARMRKSCTNTRRGLLPCFCSKISASACRHLPVQGAVESAKHVLWCGTKLPTCWSAPSGDIPTRPECLLRVHQWQTPTSR